MILQATGLGVWQIVNMVVGGAVLAALVALAKLVNSKANKADVDKEFTDLRNENKTQADESLRQYRELRTASEGIQKEITALDKNSLTKGDLVELKTDIKDLVKGQAESMKLIDGMPDRLVSLEATRNKQSEKP